MSRHIAYRLILVVVTVLVAGSALAAGPINISRSGVAIGGYDAVAYHTMGKAVKGSPKFTTYWMHAAWHFANARHRDMFDVDPEKYAPAYGGYCAYGIAFGLKMRIDPKAWRIVDGRLYLNQTVDVQRAWEQDSFYYIEQGDKSWAERRFN